MNIENIKLAYGVASASSKNGYTGAVLITDYKGFPLEFRYTDPIYPTKIQQVLYGQGLDKYIKIDVIFDNLINVFSNKTSLLIVQDEDLLQYKSDNLSIIRVSSTKMTPLSQPGEVSQVKKSEFLVQTSHANNPIRLQLSPHMEENEDKVAAIINTIVETGNYIDIDEPLNRVYKTVELICNQEI